MSTPNILFFENAKTGRALRAIDRLRKPERAQETGQPSLYARVWNAVVIAPRPGEIEAKLYPKVKR